MARAGVSGNQMGQEDKMRQLIDENNHD